MYYFLPDDFTRLLERIQRYSQQVVEIGQEMGRSCEEGAETFHDNFAFEDGERQQRMLSNHLEKLMRIHRQAQIVRPPDNGCVRIGSRTTVRDQETGKEQQLCIGSYLVFEQEGVISYRSPLAQLLMGGVVGEERSDFVRTEWRTYLILEVA